MQEDDRRSEYRRKAEQIVDKQQQSGTKSEEALIYELKVHQIELEMQNAELQSSQQELQRSRRQYEMLFDYAPVGYFVFNQEGGIVEVNQAGATMLLAERKHLSRKPFIVFLPREYHAPFFEHLRKVFKNGATERLDLQLLDRDGGNRWVRLESRQQLNPQGVQQCLTAVSDLSETRRMKDELADAKSDAIRASETEPISSLAMLYEARAPMDGIGDALESILSELPEGSLGGRVAAVRDAALALVTTLRQEAEEAGEREAREPKNQERFSVRETVEALRPLFLPSLEARGNSLTLNFESESDGPYVGDPRRIRQVLTALLSNANKFTEDGHITITVSGTRLSDDLLELTFAVSDTGKGIEPKRHRELFRQSDSFGGAGRGLVIARQLVRRLGGQIYFESTPGNGTTFSFSVPLRQAALVTEDREETRYNDIEDQTGSGDGAGEYSVLVAEDNAINVLVLRTLLERKGYRVVCVENGRDAISELQRYPHDLVLMDISMPILDGLRATEEIRSGSSGVLDPDVPIVAVTAHSMKGDKERFLAAGMNDYMSKPFDKDAVIERVEGILRSRRKG
jgi:PAS domain S-box-containing protein